MHGAPLVETLLTPGGWYCPVCWAMVAEGSFKLSQLDQYRRAMMLGAEDIARMLLDESPDLLTGGMTLQPSQVVRLQRIAAVARQYRRSIGHGS